MAGVINPLLISFVTTLRYSRQKSIPLFGSKKRLCPMFHDLSRMMSNTAYPSASEHINNGSVSSLDGVQKLSAPFSQSFPKRTHSTVLVEGNIGCGKAEFLNFFSNYPSATILEEPIDLWRNKDGRNLLDLMYKDPKANSFTFQQYVLETMMDLHDHGLDKPVSLIERSFYSARYVFIENLRNSGMLTEEEFRKLDEQFTSYFRTRRNVAVDLIVYIRTSPEVAHERILRRGREEELSIPLEYLRQLHRCYEGWILEKKHPLPAPVLVVDGDVPLKQVHAQLEEQKDRILFGWSHSSSEESSKKALVSS